MYEELVNVQKNSQFYLIGSIAVVVISGCGGNGSAVGGGIQSKVASIQLSDGSSVPVTDNPLPASADLGVRGTCFSASAEQNILQTALVTVRADPALAPAGTDPSKMALYRVTSSGFDRLNFSKYDPITSSVTGWTKTLGKFVVLSGSPYVGIYAGQAAGQPSDSLIASVDSGGTVHARNGSEQVLGHIRLNGQLDPVTTRGLPAISGAISGIGSKCSFNGSWQDSSGISRTAQARTTNITVTLKVSNEPSNKTFHILGTNPPGMPAVNVEAVVDNPNGVAACIATNFQWKATLAYNAKKEDPNYAPVLVHAPPISDTTAVKTWTPIFSEVYGGDLMFELVAKIGGVDVPVTPLDGYRVVADNPDWTDVSGLLSDNSIRKILKHESGSSQFLSTGMPKWSHDHKYGVGMGQITPYDQLGNGLAVVWDWTANLGGLLKIWGDKKAAGEGQPVGWTSWAGPPGSPSAAWKAWLDSYNLHVRKPAGKSNIAYDRFIVPNWTSTDYDQTGSGSNFGYALGMIQQDSIRAYNGYGVVHDPVTQLKLREFTLMLTTAGGATVIDAVIDEVALGGPTATLGWRRSAYLRAGQPGDPDYVTNVLNQSL